MNLFPQTTMLTEAKKAKTRAHHAVIEFLIFFALFTVASTIESIIITPPTMYAVFTDESFMEAMNGVTENLVNGSGYDMADMINTISAIITSLPAWLMLVQLFATAGMIATVLVYCTKIEKRSMYSLGLQKRGALPEYLVGMAVGLFLFSIAVLFGVLTGQISLSTVGKPSWGIILLFFLGYLIQGFSEELLCRGYFMVSLSRGCPLWVCVLSNALLFAALHLGNNGIAPIAFINLTMFGIFASLYTLRRGSLWGIAAIHSMWNFAQGNLFGISVSGMAKSPSILSATFGEGKFADLVTGGSFGLEGGIGVTVALSLAIGILLIIPTKKSELAPVPAQAETTAHV